MINRRKLKLRKEGDKIEIDVLIQHFYNLFRLSLTSRIYKVLSIMLNTTEDPNCLFNEIYSVLELDFIKIVVYNSYTSA